MTNKKLPIEKYDIHGKLQLVSKIFCYIMIGIFCVYAVLVIIQFA